MTSSSKVLTRADDILLELLHARKQRREVLMGLGRLLLGLGRIFTCLGLDFLSLRLLLPDVCLDDAELVHLGALLG
jgi:hypothetical protein